MSNSKNRKAVVFHDLSRFNLRTSQDKIRRREIALKINTDRLNNTIDQEMASVDKYRIEHKDNLI